jgi:hypothetical protein
MLGLEHTKSLDIWAFGVIMANMCSPDQITTAADVEGALNDVWEKIGYPSQSQWPCPRPPWQGVTKGLEIVESHKAVLDVLRASLRPNPLERMSAADMLKLPFWSEVPSLEDHARANEWAQSAKSKQKQPAESTRYCFTASQVSVCYPLDSTFVESDASWLISAFTSFKVEHATAAKNIALKACWPYQALELCVIIIDRALHGGLFTSFDAPSLVCSAAYVTACLYADHEPSPSRLKKWTDAKDSIESIEIGVHCVLKSMRYRLISREMIAKLKMTQNWESVENLIK